MLHEIGRGHIVAFNVLNAGASRLGRCGDWRIEACFDDLVEIRQRT